MDSYVMISEAEYDKNVKRLIAAMMVALADSNTEAQVMMLTVAVVKQFAELLKDSLFGDDAETEEEEE